SLETDPPSRPYKHPIFDDPDPTPANVMSEPDTVPVRPIQKQTQVTVTKAAKLPTEVGLPPLDLLDPAEALGEPISEETLEFTSRLIEKKLGDFGVNVTVMEAQSGPVITRYEI